MRDFPIHTALSIATLGVVLAAMHPPDTAQLRGWSRGLLEYTPELTPVSPMARHIEAPITMSPAPPSPRAVDAPRIKPAPGGALLDDSAGVLDGFYAALR